MDKDSKLNLQVTAVIWGYWLSYIVPRFDLQ